MDIKDWYAAVTQGKVLYRISPTKRYYSYCRSGGYCVQMWRWWWPIKWKVVFGAKSVSDSWEHVETYKACEEYVNRTTTMYERE